MMRRSRGASHRRISRRRKDARTVATAATSVGVEGNVAITREGDLNSGHDRLVACGLNHADQPGEARMLLLRGVGRDGRLGNGERETYAGVSPYNPISGSVPKY
jgi:hypothetical protein